MVVYRRCKTAYPADLAVAVHTTHLALVEAGVGRKDLQEDQ